MNELGTISPIILFGIGGCHVGLDYRSLEYAA
jgi:hypothetical protein